MRIVSGLQLKFLFTKNLQNSGGRGCRDLHTMGVQRKKVSGRRLEVEKVVLYIYILVVSYPILEESQHLPN